MSTEAKTRTAGWYWVNDNGWRVAQWVKVVHDMPGWWCLSGEDGGFPDDAFAEIDERPIQRQP